LAGLGEFPDLIDKPIQHALLFVGNPGVSQDGTAKPTLPSTQDLSKPQTHTRGVLVVTGVMPRLIGCLSLGMARPDHIPPGHSETADQVIGHARSVGAFAVEFGPEQPTELREAMG